FAGGRKEVRVGVSRTVGLAYLPGFFHANLRRSPEVGCTVSYLSTGEIIADLEANDLDLGVIDAFLKLARTQAVTHSFKDAFTLIAPAEPEGAKVPTRSKASMKSWAAKQRWLLIDDTGQTGKALRTWMRRHGMAIEPAMQFDSFDL